MKRPSTDSAATMTVGELITALKKYNQDALVYIDTYESILFSVQKIREDAVDMSSLGMDNLPAVILEPLEDYVPLANPTNRTMISM